MDDFLAGITKLTHDERAVIVQQAIMVLEGFHVNLPLKCAMYAVDPLRRLRLLRQRLPSLFRTDRLFHREMTQIFNSLNDLHTNYLLPEPFSSHTAWLPFAIEFCHDEDRPTYLATKVRAEFFSDRAFCEGVEILAWNGIPISRAVELFSAQSPSGAGNVAARHAFGLYTLTQRPLKVLLPPDEEWVIIGYRSLPGKDREIRVPWRVSRNPEAGMDQTRDSPTGRVQKARRHLFKNKAADAPEARRVETRHGTLGYLRIFTFKVPDAGKFIDDIIARIARLPQEGLIVDVRGNGGGRTAAAEGLLQLFAPDHPQHRIEPARLCLINTPRMLQFCKLQAGNTELAFHGLKPWIESVERAMETGAPFSASFPMTDPALCNAKGRLYPGPVIVITDGLSCSAAEVFAAGFQDHGGKVLGVDQSTAGAGASVRMQSELKHYFDDAKKESPFEQLPKGIDFSVPFRRFQRVRKHTGSEIEDFGVTPNYSYRMTRKDVLKQNVDLINEAARRLRSKRFGAS